VGTRPWSSAGSEAGRERSGLLGQMNQCRDGRELELPHQPTPVSFTVCKQTPRRAAICLLGMPAATSWDTSRSRGFRPSSSCLIRPADSGAETAFPATDGARDARAAQRRPGADTPQLDLAPESHSPPRGEVRTVVPRGLTARKHREGRPVRRQNIARDFQPLPREDPREVSLRAPQTCRITPPLPPGAAPSLEAGICITATRSPDRYLCPQ
jgi:hypothetical protein